MKKPVVLIGIFLLFAQVVFAQLANWTAYQSSKFPTNKSGQIHGQARIVQLKFHPTNPNKHHKVFATPNQLQKTQHRLARCLSRAFDLAFDFDFVVLSFLASGLTG